MCSSSGHHPSVRKAAPAGWLHTLAAKHCWKRAATHTLMQHLALCSSLTPWPIRGPCSAKLFSPNLLTPRMADIQQNVSASKLTCLFWQNSGGETGSLSSPLPSGPARPHAAPQMQEDKTLQAHLFPGSPQGNMQCGAVLCHIEVLPAKHAVDLLLQLRLLGQGQQQLQAGHHGVFGRACRA